MPNEHTKPVSLNPLNTQRRMAEHKFTTTNRALTPRQKKALQMTIDGHRTGEVCEQLGISYPTLRRWKNLPAWDQEVRITIGEIEGEGSTQIKTLLPLAMSTLKALMLTGNETTKLGAAKALLDSWSAMVTREEQQELLLQLETQVIEIQTAMGDQLPQPAIEAEILPSAQDSAQSKNGEQEAEQ